MSARPDPSPPPGASQAQDERRQTDRRSRERRSAPRPVVEESWFGAVGMGPETLGRDDGLADEAEVRLGDGAPADSRFLSRQAQRIVGSGQTAFERIYRTFISARAALGSAPLRWV